jgi:hypothetical protein
MSLSTDVLSRATPTRLSCRGGRWVLELTRLEAVDRDVFQPRMQRLEGHDSILAALRRSDDGQSLASGAAQLMRGGRPEEERSFEVSDGDWVPTGDGAGPSRTIHPPPAEAPELAVALAELRAELLVLRASHARLRDRVVALEAAQHGLGLPQRPLRGGRGRRRSEPPPAEVGGVQVARLDAGPAFDRTQASPGLAPAEPREQPPLPGPAPPQSAEPPPPGPLPPSIEDMARALNGEQLQPPLNVPSLQALNDCMGTLMEQAPPLEKSAGQHDLALLNKPQACKLLDDDGRERGIIVLDQRAAVMLGAVLLALPRAEATRQVEESDPSEDCLLATSEICNNLTGPVNAVAGNHHVRSTALSSMDLTDLPTPRTRLDLTVDGGKVVVAMF